MALEYRWGVDGDVQYVISVPSADFLLGDDMAVATAMKNRQSSITETRKKWSDWYAASTSNLNGLVDNR